MGATAATPPSPRPQVVLATDGACKGNPGPGGWAAILVHGAREKILSGAERETTNNRMELLAAIRGLQALRRPADITLATDSRYLVDGMTKWLANWKRNGWKTAAKKPVLNSDLWMELDAAAAPHRIRYEWVRGHNGHPLNERADSLANEAVLALAAKATA